MWSAGSDLAEIYLGQSTVGIGLYAEDAISAERWLPCETPSQGWNAAAEMLASGSRRLRARRRVRVWLSGGLARPFMFGPVDGLKRQAEAHDIAASLAPEATGLEGPCLVWLDAWRPGAACVAVAAQRGLRDDIERVARRLRLRLTGLAPWWVAALNATSQSPDRVGDILSVEDSDSLTVLTGSEEALTAVASYTPAPAPDQVQSVITRRMLGAGLDAARIVTARLRRSHEDADTTPAAALGRFPFAAWEAAVA